MFVWEYSILHTYFLLEIITKQFSYICFTICSLKMKTLNLKKYLIIRGNLSKFSCFSVTFSTFASYYVLIWCRLWTAFFVTEIKSSLLNLQLLSTGIHLLTLLDTRSCLYSKYLNVYSQPLHWKVYIQSSENYSKPRTFGRET